MVNRWGNSGRLYFFGLQNHCRWWLQPWNWKTLAPWKKSYDQPRQHIEKQRHYFANKGPSSQCYCFLSSHVWMWVLEYKESWRIDAFEPWCWRRLLRVPLTARGSNQSILGNQSWIFIERIVVEAETPKLWPPDVKNWLIWKHLDAWKEWRLEEKGTTVWVDSASWWWTGRPLTLQSWCCKELDWTEWQSWTVLNCY